MQSRPELSPRGLRVAQLVKSGEHQQAPIERASGIYESRGVGNSYLLTTPEGDVLVNAGTLGDAHRGRELFKQVSSALIRYIILTQSHANQYGGLEVYKTANNTVIAHQIYTEDRAYFQALSTHYQRGSRRIFSGITRGLQEILPTQEVTPDLFINEHYAFVLGGRCFEIFWTPGGETRSGLIVWLPEERIALVGNLFGPLFGNHPNLNTMRGDKPRSALEFIRSADQVRRLAPELILTGHEAIAGAQHIRTELTRIIDSVQSVLDQTLQGMNEGVDLRTLMRTVKTPAHLALTEEYGKIAWNVRAIWHEYTGWFDPNRGTTELYGYEPQKAARALAELTGGIDPIAHRARQLVREGSTLDALYLLDLALAAAPDSSFAREVKAEALAALLNESGGRNLWERMWIGAEIRNTQANSSAEEPQR